MRVQDYVESFAIIIPQQQPQSAVQRTALASTAIPLTSSYLAGKPTPVTQSRPKYPSGQVRRAGQPYQYISTGFTTVQVAVQCAMFTVAAGGSGRCTDSPQPWMPSALFPYPTYPFVLRTGAGLTESAHAHPPPASHITCFSSIVMFCIDCLTFTLSLLMYSWIPFISALIQQMLKEK